MSRDGVGVELNPHFKMPRNQSRCCSDFFFPRFIANQGEKQVAIGKHATWVLLRELERNLKGFSFGEG